MNHGPMDDKGTSSTHATQSMSSFFPLQLMFTPNGLLTNPNHINYNWYASSINMFEQQEQFKHHYNVTPYQFAKTELSLHARCIANNVVYTPPRPTDPTDATKARRKDMNRAIKTALQGKRRADMDDDDRLDANHQDVIRRRKRHLNEDKEQLNDDCTTKQNCITSYKNGS